MDTKNPTRENGRKKMSVVIEDDGKVNKYWQEFFNIDLSKLHCASFESNKARKIKAAALTTAKKKSTNNIEEPVVEDYEIE